MTRRCPVPAGRLMLVPALLVVVALAGCAPQPADDEGRTTVEVTSTADECVLSATSVPSGTVVFEVTNSGDQVTEFYLLEEDGTTIVSELENIGPGISRDLVVSIAAGTYVTACKPGMTGDGIQGELTVTDSGTALAPTQDDAARAA